MTSQYIEDEYNMSLKLYGYANCSTCSKAKKFLDTAGIGYTWVPIRETPPPVNTLQSLMKQNNIPIRKLFNTSGMDYRALGMKDKLPQMSESEALDLLSQNGNLVKRPVLFGSGIALVGFKEEVWQEALKS
jgi:arsenate reductase